MSSVRRDVRVLLGRVLLVLEGRIFWMLREWISVPVWYRRAKTRGPRGMPSVQSPRDGPVLWKKLAFQRGMAAAKRDMERKVKTRLAMCRTVVRDLRKRLAGERTAAFEEG